MEMDATKSRRRNGHGRTKRDGQKVSGINKSKTRTRIEKREESRSSRGATVQEKWIIGSTQSPYNYPIIQNLSLKKCILDQNMIYDLLNDDHME